MTPSQLSATEYPRVSGRRDSRLWLCWFLALLAVLALRLPTLTIYPTVQTDEVMMVEFGRTTLNPHTDWSVNWLPSYGPARTLFFYGPVLQEFAFRLFSGSPLGPRIFSLIGAILAATLLVAWLRERGVGSRAVWLMGIAFLLDPIFSSSYSNARVDCWAFALCICSAWLIRRQFSEAARTRADFAAGALAATALMLWPSSALLYPLLLTELWGSHSTGPAEGRRVSNAARRTASVTLGGCAAVAILLIPAVGQLSAIVDSLRLTLPVVLNPMSMGQSRLLANLIGFVGPFARSPFILVAAFLGAVLSKERLLMAATAGGVLFLLGTQAYHMRDIYLLPYFAALATSLLPDGVHSTRKRAVRNAITLLLVCAAVWAIGLSLVARPLSAWRNRNLRNPGTLFSVADTMIGPGGYRVAVQPYEFYYAGRRLGWHMFRPWVHNNIKDPQWKALLQDADYAILSGSALDSQALSILEQSGLVRKSVFLDLPKPAPLRILGIPFPTDGDIAYGPYTLFARRVNPEK